MCKRTFLALLGVIVMGWLALAFGGVLDVRNVMVVETESPHDLEQTVTAISNAAQDHQWKIPKVYRLNKSLAKEGHHVRPVAVIELCHPTYAAKLLSQDETRFVSSFMPCRVSVYEKESGQVIVSRMNTGLFSKLFPGEAGAVMGTATYETQAILAQALASRS